METIETKEAIALAQAKANLEAALSGRIGAMPISLPVDRPGAKTTDGQGEAPKAFGRKESRSYFAQ
jgi:hypothetical protein